MASLSEEEENYVRMSLLLKGVSPRAVRNFFDSEFAPEYLNVTIKKEYNKLFHLKKNHRINQSQWNLLFLRFPDVPDSKTFDVILMITLLRNLTQMHPPPCGFDSLPSNLDTTQAADLARIKHYRNYLAHLEDAKLDTSFFNTAWTDITGAIDRLGGREIKQECDHLKTKPLDQTYRELMMDVKRSNDEIKELNKSFGSLKCSHKLLQENHEKVKKSQEVLQDDHANMTKEMERVKSSQQDTVPWNIRAGIAEMLKTWKDNDDKMFVKTRAAEHVLKCLKENNCVTITASFGVGKTATLRHVALQMEEEGYDVLMVTEPCDIVNFNNPYKKTLFVFDDLCGNFSVEWSDIKKWDLVMEKIKIILEKKQTKMLAACRVQVYQDKKFKTLSVFKSCVCNLKSENICLSSTEKTLLAELYLKTKASVISGYHDLYDCFPLLCKLYHNNPKRNITDFFQNPYSVYKVEVDTFAEKGHLNKYCALALCVIFNNKLMEEILTEEVNVETRTIIENTCEACSLDRGTSRLVFRDELDSLTHTFIKKEQNMYKILHDKVFNFFAKIYGQEIMKCLIENADSGLIKERFLLERKTDMNQFITFVPQKYHQRYMDRMIVDWSKGKVQDVFSNINMKIPQFRQKFLCHLNTQPKSCQRQLAHIIDDDDNVYDTALSHCCDIGDIAFAQWCCNHGVNVNRCSYYGPSPMIIANEHGHIEIVKMLLERGADYNKCHSWGQSPLMHACEHGYTEIVKMLLDREIDYNKCSDFHQSPLMLACEHGHTEIVQMLLDKIIDCNKCDKWGQSPVMKACRNGQIDIVKILLHRGTDFNKCDGEGESSVMKACEQGHTEIVKILLDRGIDYNKCDKWGQSLVMKACKHGHIDIVKILLERVTDLNKCDGEGQSSVMKACDHGHTEIVNLLLDKGADYNKCDFVNRSPLMKACEHGHTEIVKILLDEGADYNKYDNEGRSPVMMACEHGHTEIVNMLVDKGADYNKCDSVDRSPLMNACERGHTEIVKMLLNRGVDCNKCNRRRQSPVMYACEHGHTEILTMLLDSGVDCNKCNEYDESPVMMASVLGQTEIVKMLLDRGVDYNKFDYEGWPPIMKACQHGRTEIVKMFLDKGIDYDECYMWGQSPLMKACEHGQIELVKMLLDRGADINKCDKWGHSPGMMACKHGHVEIVKLLLDREADFNKCDYDDGQSPVMKACTHGHTEIVNILVDRGVDFNKCDDDGQSLVMYACEHDHTEIVKMLLDRGVDCYKCDEYGRSLVMNACDYGHTEIVRNLMLVDRRVDYS